MSNQINREFISSTFCVFEYLDKCYYYYYYYLHFNSNRHSINDITVSILNVCYGNNFMEVSVSFMTVTTWMFPLCMCV